MGLPSLSTRCKTAVLATGSELLSGEMSDSNSAEIARHLRGIGLSLAQVRVVGDQLENIAGALQELAGGHQLLIVTGGLGPTGDDLTAAAAARATGADLIHNPQAAELIEAFFARLGRPLHPANAKQAMLPQGVRVIPNPSGTAPGFSLKLSGCCCYFLPGVPGEMRRMLEQTIIPELSGVSTRAALQERYLQVLGLAEPRVEELLAAANLPDQVEIGYGVEAPVVLIKLRAAGENASTLLEKALAGAKRALAEHLLLEGRQSIAEQVGEQFRENGWTLALAESCSGGLIGKLLTDFPGASAFLERGAISYANRAKQDWLGVPEDLLNRIGAVSAEVAGAMAEGVRRAAATDFGLSVTGIAGPEGGSREKPVGTVFIGLAGPAGSKVQEWHFPGPRERVRLLTAFTALKLLRQFVSDDESAGGEHV